MSGSLGWTPEFDIAECVANKPYQMPMVYHYKNSEGVHEQEISFPEVDWKQFHVYAVEWLPGEPLRFYIDGIKVFEPKASFKYLPDKPMFIILRMGIGNKNWGGVPDEKTVFPGYAEYDWVRVWEKSGIDPSTKIR
jgi:beta-glucanase (GH16 family)